MHSRTETTGTSGERRSTEGLLPRRLLAVHGYVPRTGTAQQNVEQRPSAVENLVRNVRFGLPNHRWRNHRTQHRTRMEAPLFRRDVTVLETKLNLGSTPADATNAVSPPSTCSLRFSE